MREIINAIKDAKLAKNNEEVANILGVTAKTVSDWVTGRYAPTLDKVQKISKDYPISIVIDDGEIYPIIPKNKRKNYMLLPLIDKVIDTNYLLSDSNKILAQSHKELSIGTKESINTTKILAENLSQAIKKFSSEK